ncbi:MAG: hypothetical protein EOM40_12605 [Clostridia bacterium]|nr:hypothetical protein [Clostridia bacterium]NCC42979.1 hypothetical protein [Clostridia bacterium]
MNSAKEMVQWHPAMGACLQIEFEEEKHSELYKAAMNAITRANWEAMEEAREKMCEALRELMAEEFQQERELGEKLGEEKGKELGKELGKEEAEIQMINNAYKKLRDVKQVAELLDVPVEKVQQVIPK